MDLLKAVSNGNDHLVQLCLNNGAMINYQNKMGETPLILAAYWGRSHVAKRLIVAGANLNVQCNRGETALSYAAGRGYHDIVNMLIRAGANTSIQNYKGRTALDYAMSNGRGMAVRLLKQAYYICRTQKILTLLLIMKQLPDFSIEDTKTSPFIHPCLRDDWLAMATLIHLPTGPQMIVLSYVP